MSVRKRARPLSNFDVLITSPLGDVVSPSWSDSELSYLDFCSILALPFPPADCCSVPAVVFESVLRAESPFVKSIVRPDHHHCPRLYTFDSVHLAAIYTVVLRPKTR